MIIPGADTLGTGFDIFGRVSSQEALLTSLIEMRSSDRTYTIDGVDYEIPTYANVDSSSRSSGTAHYFSNRRAFESHFAAEASVEASYGLFSAEFSAAYSSDRKVEESNTFAMYDVFDTRYTLRMSDATHAQVKDEVKAKFEALPATFTRENSEAFWKFFARFGTHYVSQVELGGRLFYYATIAKSYSSDKSTIEAKMKAEYTGVFGGKVEASTAWSQADERWMENRQVRLQVAGGSNSILGAIIPTRNVNKGELFQAWLESVRKNPAVMRYKLSPISDLAATEQAQNALDEAYSSFVGSKVSVHSESTPTWDGLSNIFVMGRPLMPPETTQNKPSLQFAVLDSKTLLPLQNKRCYVAADTVTRNKTNYNIMEFDKTYKAIYNSLKPYQEASHVLLFATSNILGWSAPPPDLVLFLKSCGAGAKLDSWLGYIKATSNNTSINYALIGHIGAGPGNGFEYTEYPKNSSVGADPLTLSARLIPLRSNKSVQFQPIGGGRELLTMVEL